VSDFAAFAERKCREAASARVAHLTTVEDHGVRLDCTRVGNAWSIEHYDGFFLLPACAPEELPCMSLCFVQSRARNTGAPNPDVLGGGPTDKHLIYEGLSRVAADAVMAGAATAEGASTFFSVWHPQLVALRAALGLPRHPAQIVLTARGLVDVAGALLFNVPEVPAYIIAAPMACERLHPLVKDRPLVEIIPMDDDDPCIALKYLREKHGIDRISCIGGRHTATALLDAGCVQDLCLTTAARDAGEPGTPYYIGTTPPVLEPLVRKQADDPEYPITFEHFMVASPCSSSLSGPIRRR
jgi:riboflavin biosynthesis pyrimidine reductase